MCKRTGRKLLVMLAAVMLFVLCTGTDTSASVTMKPKKEVNGKLTAEQGRQRYQIAVSQTGYIKLEMQYSSSDVYGNVYVYDHSEKNAGSFSFSYGKKQAAGYAAVKKGTYTIEVNYQNYLDDVEEQKAIAVNEDEKYEEAEDLDYRIKYSFSPMKEGQKVTGKSSAPNLKKGSGVSGLVFTDTPKKNGNAALYKYTVSKKTKIKLHINIRGNGMWMRILDANGRALTLNEKNSSLYLDKDDFTYWYDGDDSDTIKLDAGTYYFAISPQLKEATGFYKLELK